MRGCPFPKQLLVVAWTIAHAHTSVGVLLACQSHGLLVQLRCWKQGKIGLIQGHLAHPDWFVRLSSYRKSQERLHNDRLTRPTKNLGFLSDEQSELWNATVLENSLHRHPHHSVAQSTQGEQDGFLYISWRVLARFHQSDPAQPSRWSVLSLLAHIRAPRHIVLREKRARLTNHRGTCAQIHDA